MISELAAFAGGVLFGTAGVKALGSKDAKKAYAHTAAFGLRVKDSVMKTVTEIKENANDILAEAKEINEKKAAEAFRCSLENFGSFDYIDKQDDDAIRHVTILPLYALSLLRSR